MTSPARSGALVRSVLVVDDSAFMRKLISEMVDALPEFRVAGTARDGLDALTQIERTNPDIVTLDLQMPRLDGLEVLRRIMRESPRPVVVLSAGGEQFGDATLRALELGAVDFVRKPSGPVSLDLVVVRQRLVNALQAAASATVAARAAALTPVVKPAASAHTERQAHHVVVIASSTGGPRALAEIVPMLPYSIPAAIVIAQHIPGEFTPALAQRLDRGSAIAVREAQHGERLLEGTVYLARGGVNTVITGAPGSATLSILAAAPRTGATPSADLLFESAARVFGHECTGVVLTGMGRDGASGLRTIRSRGGRALVQDQASSAIYGMPRAALADAGADVVASLSSMASAIITAVSGERIEWLTA